MSIRPLARALALAAIAASSQAGEIRGRVLVDGKPAPGVAVAVLPFEDGFEEARREARREGQPQPLAAATTRPDGTFAATVAAAAGTSVRLGFSGGATAPRVLEALFDAAGDDAGDVRLPKAAALAGRVVDERGGPVVGATVTLWPGSERRPQDASPGRGVPQTATVKPDGTFRFEAAASDSNRLRVEAPAFATLERQPVRAGALSRPLTLVLGQVLRGSVTLADKRTPAKGALVRFEGRTQTTRWVETRPDGSFLLDGAPREPGSLVADGGERGRATAVLADGRERAGHDRAGPDRDARRPRGRGRRRQAARRDPPRGPRRRRRVPDPLARGRALLVPRPRPAPLPAERRGRPLRAVDRGA